jgi:signal transduction histidine kinase
MAELRIVRPREVFDRKELLRALRAFKGGDFSARMPAGLDGIDGELAEAFNDVVRMSEAMTREFARIRDQIGKEEVIDQRAGLPAANGAWAECIDAVNTLIGDLARRTSGVPGAAGLYRRATDNQNRPATPPSILQNQKEKLQRTNRRLEENARQLSEQMKQVEYKNREVELAKAALEEKAEQLASSSRYKSEFLANMSHELRTPLNSLLILAQMLAENPASNLTAKQIEYAQTIYAAGNDLLGLINDVLDLAKVESGTVSLHFAAEQLPELRDYLERTFRETRSVRFRISMERDLPPAIWTDAKRLRQILKNLLSNAFKFTAKGTVSLEVAMVTSGWTPGQSVLDGAGKVIAFAVIDTGIGIAADVQEIIFEAFQQADGSTSRHFGGTGLGLSISSKLSHLLDGEIKVLSSPGKGSTFTLFLPLVRQTQDDHSHGGVAGIDRQSQAPNPAGQSPAEPYRGRVQPVLDERPLFVQGAISEGPSGTAQVLPELAGRKVLLVDDDIRNIFALTNALEGQGMIVLNAESGLDGIEMLKNNPQIDIVLMDMMMPELDGYDTIRVMRGLKQFSGVPIIGVSAKAMKGDREKCIEAGASDYMSKPVKIDHLLSLIRGWLDK